MPLVHHTPVRTLGVRGILAQTERTHRAPRPHSDGNEAEDRGASLPRMVEAVRAPGCGFRVGGATECGDIPGEGGLGELELFHLVCVHLVCVVVCVCK